MNQDRLFIVPTNQDFQAIRGKIDDGIQMRCGGQCHCPGGGCVCSNCRKHIDSSFISTNSMISNQ